MNAGFPELRPSCPLVQAGGLCGSQLSILLLLILQGPARHYVSNALWIIINVFCLLVTFHQLRRLDTEYRGSQSASKHDEDSSEVRI